MIARAPSKAALVSVMPLSASRYLLASLSG
ncbi:hypothetical protein VEx25_0095, partial [Vibrio antiquarius]